MIAKDLSSGNAVMQGDSKLWLVLTYGTVTGLLAAFNKTCTCHFYSNFFKRAINNFIKHFTFCGKPYLILAYYNPQNTFNFKSVSLIHHRKNKVESDDSLDATYN